MSDGSVDAASRAGDRFALLAEIGSGGMGTVWRAHDRTLGREVAIKEVRLPVHLDEQGRQEACARAVREAQASARLRHPSIVVVHDVFVHDERPWIVMQLLHGQSLEAAVRGGPMTPRRTAGIGLQILDALAVAHAAGVLHRDIKPGNIFLTAGDHAVLTDFGIASVEGQATITQSGMFVGSPGFIAPERLRGEPLGPPSDLWSLAATLYRAVEGVPPHDDPTHLGALAAVLLDEPRRPQLAGDLGTLLLALLAKDPRVRPEPAVARRALQQIADGAPEGTVRVPVPPAPPPAPGGPPVPGGPVYAGGPAFAGAPMYGGGAVPARPRASGRAIALVAAAVVTVLSSLVGAVLVVTHHRDGGPAVAGPTPAPTAGQVPAVGPSPGTASPGTPSPGTPAPATPTASATPEAKFTDPFDPCTLVPVSQVRQIVPKYTRPNGVVNGKDASPACSWDAPGAGVSVQLGADRAQAWPADVADAHDRFASLQRNSNGSSKIIWHYSGIGGETITSGPATAAQVVPGVGDEAFVTDTYGRLGAQMTDVYFRVSNLLVDITYADVTGTTSKATIRARAVQMARWTADALAKRP